MTISIEEALEQVRVNPAYVLCIRLDEIMEDLEQVRRILQTVAEHGEITAKDDQAHFAIAISQSQIVQEATWCLSYATAHLASEEILEESGTEETNDRCECCFCEEKDGQK